MTFEELKEMEIPVGQAKDLTGQKFGDLTALFRIDLTKNGSACWALQCSCGEYTFGSANSLKNGDKKYCENHEINQMIGKKFGNLTVLSYSRSINEKRYYWCECECGTKKEICGKSLKNGSSQSCGCSHHKDITGEIYGHVKVLHPTNKRKNGNVVWVCECDCGEIFESDEHTLYIGRRKVCDNHFINTIVGCTFGELTALKYTKTVDNSSYFDCICSCGNHIEVRGSSLKSGNTKSCGHINSIGETNIKNILASNNYPYIPQIKFDTCRFPDTNALAKFDFYISSEDCFLLEFDGPQHEFDYESNELFSKEQLLTIRNHDLYKNQWAYENEMPLKRIPYQYRDSLTIDDILSNKFLITPDTHPQYYPAPNSSYPYIIL